MREELVDDINEEWVRTKTLEYSSAMSTSIWKYCVDSYTGDLTAIMDEHLDLGDVMETHMKTISGTMSDYLKNNSVSRTEALGSATFSPLEPSSVKVANRIVMYVGHVGREEW
ncbi:hypothetical protein LIPSTDRAFT_3233 [Lipomyces starkeyi NRRL Y-11557]|uniref:Uncharacterized protein n=1 Tax=Lipomyces starkeyi NRRL Y-11557 TaxID=675824 RepID=A0A1E3Q5A0_LIPST|nr:hypothetical protein LIPSTDRAFT_3233 [Lipomyces starkeyi NRRL Y-11557]